MHTYSVRLFHDVPVRKGSDPDKRGLTPFIDERPVLVFFREVSVCNSGGAVVLFLCFYFLSDAWMQMPENESIFNMM